eukprot:gene6506-8801_t
MFSRERISFVRVLQRKRQRNSMAKPAVIVVGADKGGVGKTTVSRTVLDYFSANNVPTRAFDTESPRGTLKRFHSDITEIVDMTTTSDQMKIFDTLNAVSPSVTVIDVRAGLLSRALADLRLKCPDDISIASTDTIPGIGGLRPRLTRTEHPVIDMTNEALRLLVDRINRGVTADPRNGKAAARFARQAEIIRSTRPGPVRRRPGSVRSTVVRPMPGMPSRLRDDEPEPYQATGETHGGICEENISEANQLDFQADLFPAMKKDSPLAARRNRTAEERR